MSKVRFKLQNDEKGEENSEVEFDLRDIQKEVVDLDGLELVLEEDANTFLLNNLLMSIQFFENYERDIKILRQNWFKDYALQSHHKKCFYADGLLSLSRGNVKFSPRHGIHKNSECQLLPLRAYISSDNIEAAFNPSVLGRNKSTIWPQYQLTVRTNSKIQKSGCISLVEFKTLEGPDSRPEEKLELKSKRPSIYALNDSYMEEQYGRRFTKTEASIAFGKILEKTSFMTPNDVIPVNSFYKFENQESRLKPKFIQDFKMNSAPATSHKIPHQCFQYEEVRNELNSRRAAVNRGFRKQKILNSAAFKGYFCDLLIERLSESLNLDVDALNDGSIHEEFIVVNQKGVQYSITPVIAIQDWNKFMPIRRFTNAKGRLLWPTTHMQDFLNALPCGVVPSCHFRTSKECLDYEKNWKVVFPKQEEFLLLHMMHAHVRCYFFALLIYKSFIETEINSASLGPKHLMHLLFWKVHKNFLAWPDDRPAETLLIFLKALYKRLQNKSLPDFFMPSRNLLDNSHPKDLHKVQTLIKKITENPIPYMIRAFTQLTFDHNFYPTFDYLKLHVVLTAEKAREEEKRKKTGKKEKKVQFQDDKERLWMKNVIKQIELERKAEKEQQTNKLSVESITTNEILTFNSDDFVKCDEILLMFVLHFTQMGRSSIELECLSQAVFYLHQTQKLFQIMILRGADQSDFKETRDQIRALKQDCYRKVREELEKSPKTKFLPTKNSAKKLKAPQKRDEQKSESSSNKEQIPKQENNEKTDEVFLSEDVVSIKL